MSREDQMETKCITRVGPLSLAKFLGCLYAVIGLIVGLFVAVFALFGFALGAAISGDGTSLLGAFLGVGAVIFLPIFYGVLGFIGGLLVGFLFNVVASMTGGLEIGLE
jgi:hypothetical protein